MKHWQYKRKDGPMLSSKGVIVAAVAISGAVLSGCEDEEVTVLVEPVAERCGAAKSDDEQDKCLGDLKEVAAKYPQNPIAICAQQEHEKTISAECFRAAWAKIYAEPDNDQLISAALERCSKLEAQAKSSCEACNALGGPPKAAAPLSCEIDPEVAVASLSKKWADKKAEVIKQKGPCASKEMKDKPLCNPKMATEKAPEKFRARFETTKGDFVIEATRSWAPIGVDRFYNLVKIGYYTDIALFRVVEGFVVQFGIHGTPGPSKIWIDAKIKDDTPIQSNAKWTVTYAKAGPNTRSVQLFVNLGNNASLNKQGFAPIGKVVEGTKVIESFYGEYGDNTTKKQQEIIEQGNKFLEGLYPKLDYIKKATLVEQ